MAQIKMSRAPWVRELQCIAGPMIMAAQTPEISGKR
jgi:hypothetical protein